MPAHVCVSHSRRRARKARSRFWFFAVVRATSARSFIGVIGARRPLLVSSPPPWPARSRRPVLFYVLYGSSPYLLRRRRRRPRRLPVRRGELAFECCSCSRLPHGCYCWCFMRAARVQSLARCDSSDHCCDSGDQCLHLGPRLRSLRCKKLKLERDLASRHTLAFHQRFVHNAGGQPQRQGEHAAGIAVAYIYNVQGQHND